MGARRGVSVHEAAGEPAGQLAPAVELGAGVSVHEAAGEPAGQLAPAVELGAGVAVPPDAAAFIRMIVGSMPRRAT